MLNNSIRTILSLLLASKDLSQVEIEQKTLKSRPTVSRTLSVLVQNKIVQIQYHAPFKTYFIKTSQRLFLGLNKLIRS